MSYVRTNHEDWQINQADNAIRRYNYFLTSAYPYKTRDISETLINNKLYNHLNFK